MSLYTIIIIIIIIKRFGSLGFSDALMLILVALLVYAHCLCERKKKDHKQ